MLVKNINHKGHFLFTPTQNSIIRPLKNVFGLKGEDLAPGQTDPKGAQSLPILLLGPPHHMTKQWVTSMIRSCLFLIGNFELRPDLH